MRFVIPSVLLTVAVACSTSDADLFPVEVEDRDDPAPAPIADPGAETTAALRPPGVALCYSPTSSNHPATHAYWRAALAGDLRARSAVITGLQAAVRQHPAEEEFALLLGLAQLWRLAEPLPAEANNPFLQLAAVLGARKQLERAYALCPSDHRIAAWLGPILVRLGRTLGDPAMVSQGMAVLDQGIAHYPSFVLFSKLLVHADEPASSPSFAEALAAVEGNIAACSGKVRDPACGNQAHVSHNVEGSQVFLGDVFAKAGRKDDALHFYGLALESPDYGSWNYQDLLEERIATIDDRIARLGNDDPADDPDVAWRGTYQCSICHAD